MPRRPRKNVKLLVSSDTIIFKPQTEESNKVQKFIGMPLYSKHEEVFRDWLDGDSIWNVCGRFNIRVHEAEDLIRHSTLLALARARKEGTRKSRVVKKR